jgi:hypothetical protein
MPTEQINGYGVEYDGGPAKTHKEAFGSGWDDAEGVPVQVDAQIV